MMAYLNLPHDGTVPGRSFWSRTRKSLGRFVHHLQHARMMSVLSQMTPEQLSAAGIARRDIPQVAAELVGLEQAPRA